MLKLLITKITVKKPVKVAYNEQSKYLRTKRGKTRHSKYYCSFLKEE